MAETSPKGRGFLSHHEGGHVLTAYRDIAGVWTIGVGLTAGSGVIVPRAGMRISREESERLFAMALAKYERRVAAVLPGARPHEFDGAVSFDFNTGKINAASWVPAFIARRLVDAERRLKLWNRAGGRRVAGLVNRREAEADLIFRGIYRSAGADRVDRHQPGTRIPPLRLNARGPAVQQLQEALARLGCDPGRADGVFGKRTRDALVAFQRAHPDLVNDGIAGAATMAQIQRNLDARSKGGKAGAAGGGGAAAGAGGNEAAGPDVTGIPTEWLLTGFAVVTVAVLAFIGWRYRDVVIQRFAKGRA